MGDIYAEVESKEAQRKIRYYFAKAAVAVVAEDGGTTNHAERMVFAGDILYGTIADKTLTWPIMTNATIAGKIASDTDYTSDIEFVVNSMYDAFALTRPS